MWAVYWHLDGYSTGSDLDMGSLLAPHQIFYWFLLGCGRFIGISSDILLVVRHSPFSSLSAGVCESYLFSVHVWVEITCIFSQIRSNFFFFFKIIPGPRPSIKMVSTLLGCWQFIDHSPYFYLFFSDQLQYLMWSTSIFFFSYQPGFHKKSLI